jgi:hypothetical protein
MGFWEVTGVRRRLAHAAIAAGVLVVPAAAAAQASAATLSVNKLCYVNKYTKTSVRQAKMIITGSGYVPGDPVVLATTDGSISTEVTASPTGTISDTIGAPTEFFKEPGSKGLILSATDNTASGQTITGGTLFKATNLAVATVPATARPARRVTWYFSGFTRGKYIYGHYLHKGREVKRARFGKAKGPCGLLRIKARFFPGGHQRYTSYGLQLDNTRLYRRKSSPRIDTALSTF